MRWTDDPVRDAVRYDLAMDKQRKMLPKCVKCGEIIDEDYVWIDEDGPHCDECFKSIYRENMEDFLNL